jgi:Mrp family chromosome partitioning ATPase
MQLNPDDVQGIKQIHSLFRPFDYHCPRLLHIVFKTDFQKIILVVQPEKNHRHLVLRAVSGLAAVGLAIGGIVANRISAENNRSYYGYGGYGYGYDYGYSGEEEAADEAPCDDTAARRAA